MIYFLLFIEFFKIGLFALGGGLATLPFLYALANKYTWFNANDLPNMVAISQATPGPIGINMATYAGFNTAGLIGSLIATLALVTPSVIIIMIIATFFDKFKRNTYVESAFYGLRPAVTALIALSGFEVLKVSIFTFSLYQSTGLLLDLINIKALILFILFIIIVTRTKLHPIAFIVLGALVGIFCRL